MGSKISSMKESESYRTNIQLIGKLILYHTMRPWLRSNVVSILTGYTKTLSSALKPVHDFTRRIIMKRSSELESNGYV